MAWSTSVTQKNAYKVLVRKSEGVSPLRRHRHTLGK